MSLDFSTTEPNYEVLADSIFRQEGGKATRYPYGIKSIKPKDEADARKIAITTAKNNYQRWNTAGQPGDYINFLADRYVPESVDPAGNKNWKSNVSKIYAASVKPKVAAPKPDGTMAPLDPLLLRPLPPVNYPMFPQYPLVAR